MREIKFRAWDPQEQKMHYLDPMFVPGNRVHDQAPWDRLIPMQFTGITDKNGKDIYEEDAVRFVNVEEQYDKIHLIEWKHSGFIVNGWTAHLMHPGTTAEVIGDKYNNPELLTGTPTTHANGDISA